MAWILNNLPAIIISIISLFISVKSWHKTRVFYGIEVFELQQNNLFGANKELQEKLSTGKYTILNTYKDETIDVSKLGSWDSFDSTKLNKIPMIEKVFILIGRIKK